MPVEIFLAPQATLALGRLTSEERAQFDRLLRSLRLSPPAGLFYARDAANRVLRVVSASTVHVIYTLVYLVGVDRILVVDITVAEWVPREE